MVESTIQIDSTKEIENLCKSHFKSKSIKEETYVEMAKLVS